MKTLHKLIFLALTFSGLTVTKAQQSTSKDYYSTVSNYNFSKLWCADSIQTQDDGIKIVSPEPLGFIGDSFQRFYIHYTSVVKSKTNPYVYNVTGKTKVKNNICTFKGTIEILKAKLYKDTDDKRYKQGFIECQVAFYEDSTENSSGTIKGKLKTNYCIDKHNRIYYDAINLVADGYSNNQCETSWTSFKTRKSKKCNWGDFRIPDSKELDSGAGDVVINHKFITFGWQTFVDSYSADQDQAKKALQLEETKWWK